MKKRLREKEALARGQQSLPLVAAVGLIKTILEENNNGDFIFRGFSRECPKRTVFYHEEDFSQGIRDTGV
jgi:hypothetical protein